MGGKQLRVLQANLRKGPETQHALVNDENIKRFSLLLIQEPACFRTSDDQVISPPTTHHYWNQFVPTKTNEEGRHPVRSVIYASQEVRARQIDVPSPDITAIEFETQARKFLVFSVYVPPKTGK
jgi:hypothetical protein